MMLFTLLAFGALQTFGMYGDTCRCNYIRFPFFGVIRWGTDGECVYPDHRECVYSEQAKNCVCQNKHNGDDNPPTEVRTTSRRNGVVLVGGVATPISVIGGQPPVTGSGVPSVGTTIQQPIQMIPINEHPFHQDGEGFADIFTVPTACANANFHRHHDEMRRLTENRMETSVYGALTCVGGYALDSGVKCRARRLNLDDYALNVPGTGSNEMVNLAIYLDKIAGDQVPGKPEVCRLATDCQVLNRYELLCNSLVKDSCNFFDFCYWGNYGERRL